MMGWAAGLRLHEGSLPGTGVPGHARQDDDARGHEQRAQGGEAGERGTAHAVVGPVDGGGGRQADREAADARQPSGSMAVAFQAPVSFWPATSRMVKRSESPGVTGTVLVGPPSRLSTMRVGA